MSKEDFLDKIDKDELTMEESETVKKIMDDIQKVMQILIATTSPKPPTLLNGLLKPGYKIRRIILDTRWITLLCFEGE